MAVLPMIWLMVGMAIGIPLYEHGYEAWVEAYGDSLLLFGGWFIGTITGVVLFVGAIDAEERENKEWKFQDRVFEHYDAYRGLSEDEEDAINNTAIHFDISPSAARNIVKIYEDD